jgi:hypothetical protein
MLRLVWFAIPRQVQLCDSTRGWAILSGLWHSPMRPWPFLTVLRRLVVECPTTFSRCWDHRWDHCQWQRWLHHRSIYARQRLLFAVGCQLRCCCYHRPLVVFFGYLSSFGLFLKKMEKLDNSHKQRHWSYMDQSRTCPMFYVMLLSIEWEWSFVPAGVRRSSQ